MDNATPPAHITPPVDATDGPVLRAGALDERCDTSSTTSTTNTAASNTLPPATSARRFRVWLASSCFGLDVLAADAEHAQRAALQRPVEALIWYRERDVPPEVRWPATRVAGRLIALPLTDGDPCPGCGYADTVEHELEPGTAMGWWACAHCATPVCACHCAYRCTIAGCDARCCPIHTKESTLDDRRVLCFAHALAAGYSYDEDEHCFVPGPALPAHTDTMP